MEIILGRLDRWLLFEAIQWQNALTRHTRNSAKKEYKVMTKSSKSSTDNKLTQSRTRFVAHSHDFKIDSLLAIHEFWTGACLSTEKESEEVQD